MSLVQTAPDDPTFQLWRIARIWLADAVHAFGAPPAIARQLTRDVRRALTRRVKALEILLMKLLLVQAAALTCGFGGVTHTPQPTSSRTPGRGRRACVSPHNSDKPET